MNPPDTPIDLPATRREVDSFRQKITTLTSEKPAKAAIILTDWLDRSPPVKQRNKKAA